MPTGIEMCTRARPTSRQPPPFVCDPCAIAACQAASEPVGPARVPVTNRHELGNMRVHDRKKKKERKTERKNEILRMLGRVNTSSNEAGYPSRCNGHDSQASHECWRPRITECSCGVAAGEGGCLRLLLIIVPRPREPDGADDAKQAIAVLSFPVCPAALRLSCSTFSKRGRIRRHRIHTHTRTESKKSRPDPPHVPPQTVIPNVLQCDCLPAIELLVFEIGPSSGTPLHHEHPPYTPHSPHATKGCT
jgi:hypothetical protein